MRNDKKSGLLTTVLAPLAATLLLSAGTTNAQDMLNAKSPTVSTVSSTVPSNGDINPYGVFAVPRTVGQLNKGSILVSNFNAGNNFQGTGTTIVQISPTGNFSLFAQINPATLPGSCPGGVGLTTALVVLRSGWVIVGSLPTSDGGIRGKSPESDGRRSEAPCDQSRSQRRLIRSSLSISWGKRKTADGLNVSSKCQILVTFRQHDLQFLEPSIRASTCSKTPRERVGATFAIFVAMRIAGPGADLRRCQESGTAWRADTG